MKRTFLKGLLAILINFSFLFSQELPPIQNFTPQEYGADNQNWAVSDSDSGSIFFGNNWGLLEFNGADWSLYPSPNNIIRAVKSIDDKVYIGCFMEFGYWERNNNKLEYVSISKKHNIKLVEDEHIWQIERYNDWVLFKSLNSIYVYDKENDSIFSIQSKSWISNISVINNSIYFQKQGEGLFKIESGKSVLVSNHKLFIENTVVKLFSSSQGILVLFKEKGFFFYNNSKLTPWQTKLSTKIKVYSACALSNGNIAIGSVGKGLFVVDPKGNIVLEINQSQGIQNNTILSIFEDKDQNLWLALDKGVSLINLNSPFKIYTDTSGLLGTVYASSIFKNYLYLGTNQGLFVKDLSLKKGTFKLISGTGGQVWQLRVINNTLFCGHNEGAFIVKGETAKFISNSKPGVWDFKLDKSNSKVLMGSYNGLSYLKYQNEEWIYDNELMGFETSSRFYEIVDDKIFVFHPYKGLYKLPVNKSNFSINSDVAPLKLEGRNANCFYYDDSFMYSDSTGVYKYSKQKRLFEKDSFMSDVFPKTNSSKVRVSVVPNQSKDKLWVFALNKLYRFSPGRLSKTPVIDSVYFPSHFRGGLLGFENIFTLNENRALLGTANGYILYDLEQKQESSHEVSITSVSYQSINSDLNSAAIDSALVNPYEFNNLEFKVNIPVYSALSKPTYRYKLEGKNQFWSDWSSESRIRFENLKYGKYSFIVQAKINGVISKNKASFNFEISKPWYLSSTAIVAYLVAVLLIIFIINSVYRAYYNTKQQKLLKRAKQKMRMNQLETKQKLTELNNEKLKLDIENKNRELAISTMSLIKKNEFLNSIKSELSNVDGNKEIKNVLRIIDRNLNNTDDWKFFQEAFNNADKDFLKKIGEKHPELTPNDLRLCAYLRLNLSSKEIAPLLNISYRSVEVKRYRLRKKMKLKASQGLIKYILDI